MSRRIHSSSLSKASGSSLSNYTIAEASVLPELEDEDARSISRDDYVMSQDEENEMSEQQLRELYNNEEIERFINLFSAYVTEVRLPDTPATEKDQKLGEMIHEASPSATAGSTCEVEPGLFEEGDWVSINGSSASIPSNDQEPPQPSNRCLSEVIAFRYLVPILPPAPLPPPLFTIGRLRLTTQRLYLAIEPAYASFFSPVARLATWENRKNSLFYCILFWTLWYKDILLPSLFLRAFYCLAYRKLFPYPTLIELRERRSEVSRAMEFGEEVSARLSASSSFGLKEIWRLFKVFNKTKKIKVKHFAKEKAGDKGFMKPEGKDGKTDGGMLEEQEQDATVLDDTKISREERDLKRRGLHALSEIGDLHERIKNIFIWRRPASSYMYGGIIFSLFLLTLLLPAKYLAKLTYFVGGFFFWHVTPIIASLPPAERARLPAPFEDVPTDADYAMELISQRVAAGLDVKPRPKKERKKRSGRAIAIDEGDSNFKQGNRNNEKHMEKDNKFDWKKWGERAALVQVWADDGKRLISGRQDGIRSPHSPGVPQPAAHVETHSRPLIHPHSPLNQLPSHSAFPAQHTTAPGLITLTPTTFFFTPLMSVNAKIVIPFVDLRGVKKTGMFKGVSLRWGETRQGEKDEKEEKFMWVGGRDEMFARLIGAGGRRWMKA